MIKSMKNGAEAISEKDVFLLCQSNLKIIKEFLDNHSDQSVPPDLQEEISRLIVLLQKIEKLIIKTSSRKLLPQKERLRKLNALIEFLQLAIESLFHKASNRELVQQIRIDIERNVYRYEHGFLGFFINRFMDLYRSKSVPLRVVAGLTVSSSIAAIFIFACFLVLSFRPSEIDDKIRRQEAIRNKLVEELLEENTQKAASAEIETLATNDNNQDLTALAVQLGLRVNDPKMINLKTQTELLSLLREQREAEQADANFILLILLVAASGILGSVISILTRIDQFDTDEAEAQKYADPILPIFIGAFKPIIGASFGLLFFAIINSGVNSGFIAVPTAINVEKSETQGRNRESFFCAVAFIVGFSERLAKDFIRKAEGTIGVSQTPSQGVSAENLEKRIAESVESVSDRLVALKTIEETPQKKNLPQSNETTPPPTEPSADKKNTDSIPRQNH